MSPNGTPDLSHVRESIPGSGFPITGVAAGRIEFPPKLLKKILVDITTQVSVVEVAFESVFVPC